MITLPLGIPAKGADAQYTYTFAGWSGYSNGMTVSGSVTFNALFTEAIRKYNVTFIGYNVPIVTSLEYNSIVVLPDVDPVKTSVSGKEYEFIGWNGYTNGMTVTKDLLFEPMFKAILLIDADELDDLIDNGTIQIGDSDSEQLSIPKEVIEAINEKVTETSGVNDLEIKTQNGTIKFGSDVVDFLNKKMEEGSGMDSLNVDVIKVDNSSLSQAFQNIVNDRPVFDITISGIGSFGGGKLTIGLKYDLKAGEDPNNIVVWCVNADRTIDSFNCTYENGYVYFETTHLSYYCIAYVAADAPDEGIPMMYILAAGVVAIIAIVAVVMIRRH